MSVRLVTALSIILVSAGLVLGCQQKSNNEQSAQPAATTQEQPSNGNGQVQENGNSANQPGQENSNGTEQMQENSSSEAGQPTDNSNGSSMDQGSSGSDQMNSDQSNGSGD